MQIARAGTENITKRPIVMSKDWSLMADRKVVAEAAASALDETPERTAAELLSMDDDKRHRAKISKLLSEYIAEIPSLRERLNQVLELPDLTESKVIAIESFTGRIAILNKSIRNTINTEDDSFPYEHSILSTDRLREEIAMANLILDRMLVRPRGA